MAASNGKTPSHLPEVEEARELLKERFDKLSDKENQIVIWYTKQFQKGHSMWKTLTNEQILAWNKLALNQEGRSVLGTKAKLSGSNMFTRLNYWIVTLGGQVLVTPPEINSVEAPSTTTIVCQGNTFTFKR